MSYKTFIILVVVGAASANFVDFRKCRDGSNPPDSFFSTDCTPAAMCTIRRNSEFSGEAIFKTTFSDVTSAKVQVDARAFGMAIPMEIPEGYDQLCNHLSGDAQCPLNPGISYTWSVVFPVEENLPLASGVVVEIRAVDQRGNTVVCAEVDGAIVA